MAYLSFVEESLELCIDYGAVGGPQFKTLVVSQRSGQDYRNIVWPEAKGQWQVGNRVVNKAEMKQLLDFFHRRRGKAIGFRWKDWADYEISGIAATQITPTEYQVMKRYGDDDLHKYEIEIEKIIPGSVQLIANGIELVSGWSVSSVTGRIRLDTPIAGDLLVTCEFEKKVRFDVDSIDIEFNAYDSYSKEALYTVSSIPIIELR